MKRFTEQLQKKANSVSLRAAEKRDLRERVVSYMEYHPLPAAMTTPKTSIVNGVPSEFSVLQIRGMRFFQWAGATIGVLLLVITLAAEKAVPGDSLYAVKVSFNEEVRSTLARSPYEKVVWETERLNRRISEARLLASEGRLTNEVEIEVAEAVREHSNNARKGIEELKQTDKEEAALATIQLATTLDVQSTSLKNNTQENEVVGKSTALIASAVADSQANEVLVEADEIPSFVRLIAQGELETTRAYELLKNIKSVATPEEQSDVERRLEDIQRAISETSNRNNDNNDNNIQSRKELVVTLQRTQRLIVFMTNIDIRKTVTVEQIVPVILTSEERMINVRMTAKETLSLLALSEVSLASSTSDVRAKIGSSIEDGRAVANSVLEALLLPEGDITGLEQQIKSVHEIALDVATLLNIDRSKVGQEIILPESSEVSTSTATTSAAISGDAVLVEKASTSAAVI